MLSTFLQFMSYFVEHIQKIANFQVWSGANVCLNLLDLDKTLMLKNEEPLARIGFDTTESTLSKICI